jgi:type I restriction enzyme S subunit
VYGSNGIVGYHHSAVTKGPCIIIGRKGSIGEVHYSPVPCWPIDTTYFIENTQVDCDLVWLKHWLQALNLPSLNRAAAIPGLNREDAHRLEIPLPPFTEQKRIAALLNDQLAAVERARAAAAAQLEAAKALPAAYLRQAFPMPGEKLPAGWRWVKLGQLVTRRTEMIHPYDRPRGTGLFVGLEHIESGTGVRIGALLIDLAELQGRKPKFYAGDLVYGYLRPYLNKVWVADFDGYCSVDQYVFQINQNEVEPGYLAAYMRSPAYLALAPIRTTPGQLPRIRSEEVQGVPMPLPPLNEQRQFLARLDQALTGFRQVHEALTTQLAQLDALPSSYLRQAFRGGL